jgi:transcriptional regulator with XRE-family HTH domain
MKTRTRYQSAAECGAVIRTLRRERKLSLKALAKTSGIPFQYLSRIERGEVNIPYETLHIIAQSLKVPMPQLIPDETPMTPAQIVPLLEQWTPDKLSALYAMLTLLKMS